MDRNQTTLSGRHGSGRAIDGHGGIQAHGHVRAPVPEDWGHTWWAGVKTRRLDRSVDREEPSRPQGSCGGRNSRAFNPVWVDEVRNGIKKERRRVDEPAFLTGSLDTL